MKVTALMESITQARSDLLTCAEGSNMYEGNHHERPKSDDRRRRTSGCHLLTSSVIGRISRYKGFAFGFASACCYGCSTLIVSTLSDDIGTTGLVFVRFFMSAFLCLIILCYTGIGIRISSVDEFKLHLSSSLLGMLAIWCQFYAYQNMPPADACAILYSHIVFSGLLARIFFKEPFGCFEMLLVLSTFSGVILITRPPFLFDRVGSTFEVTPPLVALCGAISASLSNVVMRAMGKQSIHPLKVVLWISILSSPFLIIVTTLMEWSLPCDINTMLRVFGACFSVFLGLTLLNYSLAHLHTVYVSVLLMNEVYIVFLLDIVLFGFQPRWTNVVGMLIITGSSIVLSLRKVMTSSESSQLETEKECIEDVAFIPNSKGNKYVLPVPEKTDYSVLEEREEATTS